MKTNNRLLLSTSPPTQPARKLRRTASLALRQRSLCGRTRRNITGKELDTETGLYYYGARYLDPKISRWLSGDPAVGEYIPQAGNQSSGLSGMGGVYNTTNLHTYHYAGNNPVKYIDPDGKKIFPNGFTEAWRFLQNTSIGQTMNRRYNNPFISLLLGRIDINIYGGTRPGFSGITNPIYEQFTYQAGVGDRTDYFLISAAINIKDGLNTKQQALVIAHELMHVDMYPRSIPANRYERQNSMQLGIVSRSSEYAAFRTQFNTASELYQQASSRITQTEWADALKTTVPSELRAAHNLYDISKGFDEQSRSFFRAFDTGIDAYMNNMYRNDGTLNE